MGTKQYSAWIQPSPS